MNELEKTSAPAAFRQPVCSISENDGKVRLRVEMAGVDRSGLEVSVEKNELIITGHPAGPAAAGTYLVRERAVGEYRKRFILDDTVDRDSIAASMQDGVLELTLGIKEAAKARKIAIA
jgi:HSP20 family protein